MITKFKIFENLSPDYGYRSGDLKHKAENMYRMDSGRGTGHFGTGFYFFGSEEDAKGYDKRDVVKVDFSKYNLLKIKNRETGLDLHYALKQFNNNVINLRIAHEVIEKFSKYQIIKKIENFEKENDISFSYHEIQDLLDYKDLFSEAFDTFDPISKEEFIKKSEVDKQLASITYDFFKEQYKIEYDELYKQEKNRMIILLRNALWKNNVNVNDEQLKEIWKIYLEVCDDKTDRYKHTNIIHEWKNLDTASTRIIKSLGFEGIDVRGIYGLDNSEFGSVIYDIK